MTEVRPAIRLVGSFQGNETTWEPRRTLLDSADDAPEFVAEVEDDGIARLRFGDDRHGRRPDTDTEFRTIYRVGNGTAGNVGPESIFHVITAESGIAAVRNPLPAAGGVDSESAESVRRRAPEAFRGRERAVTPEDYSEVTERKPGIQNAAARLRWTGSWHTVFITVDREGGGPLTPELRAELQIHVDRYRMAGHDLEFNDPIFVPIELALLVCVRRDWFRADVRRGLTERLSNRTLRDGRRGLFHPDNFSFGDPVYLSRIYAAAREVPGVASVEVKKFRRQYSQDTLALADGRILLSPLEIARLDNDPDFPERGVIELQLFGGK